MSILNKLTEGIVGRDLRKEGDALLGKWEKTGLLEGIDNDANRQGMARLLENQAAQLLREASTMEAGNVEGFASVAFPLVRRVFGGLLANDIVSVQPMSLPSGLIFFLDFTTNRTRLGSEAGESVYGGGKVASEITGGVSLTGDSAEDSFYNLNNGYGHATGSSVLSVFSVCSGTYGGKWFNHGQTITNDIGNSLCRYDPDFTSGTTNVVIGKIAIADMDQLNQDNLVSINFDWTTPGATTATGSSLARRLTQLSGTKNGRYQPGDAKSHVLVFFHSDSATVDQMEELTGGPGSATQAQLTASWAAGDDFGTGKGVGSVVGTSFWSLENESQIPEIDIKVDSIAVTAMTKKLKAKWTPELGQDLNAYHNLDAEVELTSILSEQIALEIDREILEDLVKGATAGTYYWSRSPGMFLKRDTGFEVGATSAAPDFTGTVSEWYETLVETMNDVSAAIHRKTLRGGANFIVVGPEVANILEFTAGFRASVTGDDSKGTVGAIKVGSMSKKWDVFVDPYFPRNIVLVGRKGGSFLESGYVYAPYVPLQVTPTIFGIEDFVPRKGVMTRYAKKMVRPDMYGLVIVRGLMGEAGG
jgi:hypothetical protein